MARGKRMSAKIQAAVNTLLNGVSEPTFNALTSEKIDLLKGLNYYAIHAKQEYSKKWALEWVKENMPKIYNQVRAKKDWRFSNIGFVIRMSQNGFVLSDAQIENIKAQLIAISEAKEEEEQQQEKKPAVAVKKPVLNKALESFDYAIDAVMMGKGSQDVALGTDKKHQQEVVQNCDKILGELEANPEYYAKEKIRPLKKFLNAVKKQVEAVVQVVKQQKVRKVAPKKINPAKMASKMQYKKTDSELKLTSVKPEALIGAKQAMIYDTKYRFLMYFKAASDEGFMASGTSLKNFDIEKSVFKKIRKPEDMVEVVQHSTLATIKKFFENLKSKTFGCKGRFNENMLILKVTG